MTTETMTVYRRSALEDADCLYRFEQVHLRGVDDSSDFALRGQAFAHIKFLYIQRLLAARIPADAEEAEAAFIEGIATHQTPSRLIPELRELWTRHAEVFTLDLDRFLTAEERLQGDGVSFAPDLVYAHPSELEVRDDKTYWICLTEDEIRQTYQARFYAWQAMRRWPHFPSYRITFVFVRFNKQTSVVFSQAEIDQMELEVRADVARIEEARRTESYPATIGPACRYCELKCPLADNPLTMPARLSVVQATEVARNLIPAEKMIKAVKKAFKGYCVSHGPVDAGNGQVWGNWPVTERKYPVAKVMDVLSARNVFGAFTETAGLTISQSALAKVFKQFPILVDELQPYVQEKTTYRFGLKKDTEDASDGE